MADYNDRLKQYVQVNERIAKFYEEYANGSIVTEIVKLEPDRVIMKAYVYRDAIDQRPCTGHSWMAIPGPTPYTKGSEIENAETSAVGRALAMMGFEVKRGIASREEIENKSDDGYESVDEIAERLPNPTMLATKTQRAKLWASIKAELREASDDWVAARMRDLGIRKDSMTIGDIKKLELELAATKPPEGEHVEPL